MIKRMQRLQISLHCPIKGGAIEHKCVQYFFADWTPFSLFLSMSPLTEASLQATAECRPRWQLTKDWQFPAGWGNAGFEPGTAGHQSGAPLLVVALDGVVAHCNIFVHLPMRADGKHSTHCQPLLLTDRHRMFVRQQTRIGTYLTNYL